MRTLKSEGRGSKNKKAGETGRKKKQKKEEVRRRAKSEGKKGTVISHGLS